MQIDRYLTPPDAQPTGWTAHPVWALGFRPFFLLAGLFASLWLPLWLVVYFGAAQPPLATNGMSWHAHEMVFGFGVAVLAGFLLTAVRNWTRQATPSGAALAGLAALWLLGRIAMLLGGALPGALVAAIDVAFLPAVALAIGAPILRARNRRNAAFPLLLLAFAGLNLLSHVADPGLAHRASVAGVDLLMVMLVLMGGRVIPFFTRNALPEARVVTRPWLDWLALAATAAVLPARLVAEGDVLTAAALVAGAANLARLLGWGGLATLRTPILWVLHVGYLWVGVGLLLTGLARWLPELGLVATHALTVGALGTLILGMISRVSLGHTGRPLVVPRAIVAAYVLITLAALARVFLPLMLPPAAYAATLYVSGGAWTLAFALFTAIYWPILTRPRADGAPG